MKKTALFLTLATLSAAAIALAACGSDNNTTTPPANIEINSQTETGTYTGITSSEAIYGVAAVTSAKLLSTFNPTGKSATAGETNPVYSAAEEFNKYFNMLDTFFDKDNTKTEIVANTSQESEIKDYAYKLTVTGKNAQGENVIHTVYFSESEGVANHNSYRDDDEYVTIDSITYTMDGVVDMGEVDGNKVYYHTEGVRVEQVITETEGRKSETEKISNIDLKCFADVQNRTNFVQLINSHSSEEETGEIESEDVYTYSVFENGKIVESTQVGFETESEFGKQESEYSVKFMQGASRGYFEIEREIVNGATVIQVEYTLDGQRGKFTIEKRGENYRYLFDSTGSAYRDFADYDD